MTVAELSLITEVNETAKLAAKVARRMGALYELDSKWREAIEKRTEGSLPTTPTESLASMNPA